MSFEFPDQRSQPRIMPDITWSHAAIRGENRRRGLSSSTLATLNQLVDEILDMDPPASGSGDRPAGIFGD